VRSGHAIGETAAALTASRVPFGARTTHSPTARSAVISRVGRKALSELFGAWPSSCGPSMRGLPLTSDTVPSFSGMWISNIKPRTVFRASARLVTYAGSQPPLTTAMRTRQVSEPSARTSVRSSSSLGSESAIVVIHFGKRAASRSRSDGGGLRQKFILSQPPISTAPSCGCMNGFQSTCAWPPHCSSLHWISLRSSSTGCSRYQSIHLYSVIPASLFGAQISTTQNNAPRCS
jgi:hypothetical protein